MKSTLKKSSRHQSVPVIPLARPETKGNLTKGKFSVLKFKNSPNAENSATYERPILQFKSGSAKEFPKWKCNVDRAVSEQGLTDDPGKYNLTRKLLDGDALMLNANHVTLRTVARA